MRSIQRLVVSAMVVFAPQALGQPTTFNPEAVYRNTLRAVNPGSSARIGGAVSIQGTAALAGAPADQSAVNRVGGRAYLFDLQTGLQGFEYAASDGDFADQFGFSVKLDPQRVAIGSPRDDDGANNSGAVYLYSRGSVPNEEKITPPDPQDTAEFGFSLDIHNDILVVGAPNGGVAPMGQTSGDLTGAAYVFDLQTGTPGVKLLASDRVTRDGFGHSVAIDNGIVVVGAPFRDEGSLGNAGAVYVFDAATGQELGRLIAPDAGRDELFGFSVAIDQDIIAVGARNGSVGSQTSTGSVYVFDTTTLAFEFEVSPQIRPNGVLGDSVAVENFLVASGAPFAGLNGAWGEGLLFDGRFGAQIDGFRADPSIGGDEAGDSIDLEGTVLILGAPGLFNGEGGVHVFDLIQFSPVDFDRDQDVDADDVTLFIQRVSAGDPSADFNDDGRVDYFDVIAFLNVVQLVI